MPLAPAPAHAPGGRLHFEYGDAAHGERHSIHLACAHFVSTPVGARGDYRYDHDAPGPFIPTEDGVAQTAAAIIAHWSYYYTNSWTCRLVRVYYNADGLLQPLEGVPDLTGLLPSYPMAGINLDTNLAHGPTKRRFLLLGGSGHRWRLWFSQVPGGNVGASVLVTPDAGGLDWRDRRVIRYLSGTATGICDAAGERFKPEARVGVWWARPLVPVPVPTGGGDDDDTDADTPDQYLGPAPPSDPQPGWIWLDTSAGAPYPVRVWDAAALPPVESLQDTGFETPALADGAFAYNPSDSPWTFDARTGVSANGSGFTSANDPAPEGRQVGLIQYSGVMSQPFTLSAATSVTLTLAASSRGGYPAEQTIHVLIDGVQRASFAVTNTPHYQDYTTPPVALAAGAHTLALAGTQSSDRTAFIDHLRLQGTTPGAWVRVAGGDRGPAGPPGPTGPAGVGSSGVDGSGLSVGDCVRFPRGASVCNDEDGTVHIATPEGLHGFDATGITLPGGARLEVVEA